MINLVIDIGNTRTKVALFKKGKITVSFQTESFTIKDIISLKKDYPRIKGGILSSVRNNSHEIIEALNQELDFVIELNHHVPIPLENCYKTPHTLGKDRIAAAVGANKLYPNQNILIIDAGTAVTYDFVSEKNQYLGGFISPGLNMRFKALHHFTEKLPLLNSTKPENIIGNNTNDSIIGGIQYGLEGEIQRMIQYFSPHQNELIIILTGGDTKYFDKLLKNHNFATHEITLLGLNTILEFNYIR